MAVVIENGKDPTLGVNNFNETKILSVSETYARNLLVLLLGRPGFYPSQPELGMDIEQYLYQFFDEINVEEIKAKLILQCEDFLPEIDSGDFDVYKTEYNGNPMLIFQLPVVIDRNTLSMALGVTINAKGELIYNFVENKTQLV